MSEDRVYSAIPTRILLPIDFSPSSQVALEMAADLALHFHASLHLIHVIPAFTATTFPDFTPEQTALREARAEAEENLRKCCTNLASRGIDSSFNVEEGNDVAGVLVDEVEHANIDMVIISTHGIGGWHPLVFGSIAEKVVKLVQCPVLLLRSQRPASSATPSAGRLMEWW